MTSKHPQNTTAGHVYQAIGQLFDNRELCDICVVIEKEEFPCHGLVLASASQFFKKQVMANEKEIHIKSDDVSPELFQDLLEILYKNSDLVDQETAKDFLKISCFFEIDFLIDICEDFLMQQLLPEDSVQVWLSAQRYKLPALADKACRTAAENIENIQHKEWLDLDKSMILMILSLQDKLSMEKMFEKILRWVKHCEEGRKKYLVEFLPFFSFPLMKESYVCTLNGFSSTFSSELFGHVNEAIIYHMKGVLHNKQITRRKILAKQTVKLDLPEIKSLLVCVNGLTQNVSVLIGQNYEVILAQAPQKLGKHFSSCTFGNDIYVSGGSLQPKYFAMFSLCYNQWKQLTDLPDSGRKKHTMAVVKSEIYALGGTEDRLSSSSVVLQYSILSKEWVEFCRLPVGVEEASAAVLGHRIYLVGGRDSKEEETDLVQCVDTSCAFAYIAGKLPFPTCRPCAVSNGGMIYVLAPTGQVLKMWEDYILAEEIATSGSKKENDKPTVVFQGIANISGGDRCWAFLNKKKMTVHRTTRRVVDIDLVTGKFQEIQHMFTTCEDYCDLHMVNVPTCHIIKKLTSLVQNSLGASLQASSVPSSSIVDQHLLALPVDKNAELTGKRPANQQQPKAPNETLKPVNASECSDTSSQASSAPSSPVSGCYHWAARAVEHANATYGTPRSSQQSGREETRGSVSSQVNPPSQFRMPQQAVTEHTEIVLDRVRPFTREELQASSARCQNLRDRTGHQELSPRGNDANQSGLDSRKRPHLEDKNGGKHAKYSE